MRLGQRPSHNLNSVNKLRYSILLLEDGTRNYYETTTKLRQTIGYNSEHSEIVVLVASIVIISLL